MQRRGGTTTATTHVTKVFDQPCIRFNLQHAHATHTSHNGQGNGGDLVSHTFRATRDARVACLTTQLQTGKMMVATSINALEAS